MYWLAYYVVRYRRKIVFSHLEQSFPELNADEITQIAKRFYRNFADVSLEIFKVGSMTEKQLSSRVEFTNLEALQPIIESGQSMILLSAHYCNWEWLLLSTALEIPMPLDVVYKPLHNESMNDFMYETRSRFNVEPIDLNDFTREIVKRKSTQRAYCILADQKPRSTGKSHTTEFLNRETPFFIGPEKIAQFVKIPVVFVTMQRVRQGYYQVTFKVIAEPPYEKQRNAYPVTERYVRQLEKLIQDSPEGWLWSNRRWRSREQERAGEK
jgi:KDO2-lipid IV(A) lauroyltransferase